jgi:2'-5' RNA ligase
LRAFIAIEIPAEIKTALGAAQASLRPLKADVSWTKAENVHLTLKFLGEVAETRLDELRAVMCETTVNEPYFALNLDGMGVFPNARQPRVLWTGLAGDVRRLQELQKTLDAGLRQINMAGGKNDFHPHLTIGRIKSNRNTSELIAAANQYALPALSFNVSEIVLMKSELHPAGARYTAVIHAPLRI